MITTNLKMEDSLPLTCSRTGTCCHGKLVLLNPYELACLSNAKGINRKDFFNLYTEWGGVKLLFNGSKGYKSQQACSQYIPDFGCSVHEGRPLSCRLYPLGRQIQNDIVDYIFQGQEFPCLEGCAIVNDLPKLTVSDYLKGQKSEKFEKAQDGYLEMMQKLADIAFVLLLETGLAESGDKITLSAWRIMSEESPEELINRVGEEWLNALILPEIEMTDDPLLFIQNHLELLQNKAQEQFGTLKTIEEIRSACITIMATALHLARSVGAKPADLMELWIETAVQNGASI